MKLPPPDCASPRNRSSVKAGPPSHPLPPANPSSPSGSLPTRSAFTLLEILLAVAIFSVVLIAIHSVFHVALRLRNRTVQAIESDIPLQQTLSILRRDLADIVPPGGTFGGALESNPITEGDTVSGTPLLQFHAAVGVLSEDSPWGEIHRIAYVLTAPTNSTSEGLDLVRAVTRNLLPVSTEDVESQRLMSGIETMTFEFHDGASWRPTWDSTNETTLLPRAIKAQIQLITPRDSPPSLRQDPIELVVGLLIEPPTDTSATNALDSTTTGGGGGGGTGGDAGGGAGGSGGGTGGGGSGTPNPPSGPIRGARS